LLNTISGVQSIQPILIEAARTLHAKRKTFSEGAASRDDSFHLCGDEESGSDRVDDAGGGGIHWCEGRLWISYMIMTPATFRAGRDPGRDVVIGLIGLFIDIGLRATESRVIRWR